MPFFKGIWSPKQVLSNRTKTNWINVKCKCLLKTVFPRSCGSFLLSSFPLPLEIPNLEYSFRSVPHTLCSIVSTFCPCWSSLWNISSSCFISFCIFTYPIRHSVIIRTSCGAGTGLGARAGDTIGIHVVCSLARKTYLKPMLTNVMSISKPKMLWEQITGKPNLI